MKKNIPTILTIENSSSLCSVCINDNKKIFYTEQFKNVESSRFILNIIDYILYKSKIKITCINALSFSIGPGNFTSMRITMSVIKGIALGYKLPIIKVSSLKSIALEAFYTYKINKIFAAIISNTNEISYGIYIYKKKIIKNILNKEIKKKNYNIKLPYIEIAGVGNGCYKYKNILSLNNLKLKIKYNINYPKAIYTHVLSLDELDVNNFCSIKIKPKYLD